jgi:Holliday junction DNA helicase RuvA
MQDVQRLCIIKSMIRKLSGEIDEISDNEVILNVSGVGYGIRVSNHTLLAVRAGMQISFYTHHALRENASDLYGFLQKSEQDFFELLLGVSGIGPKSAMGIMNTASVSTIIEGIQSGNADYFAKISGIGKKNAEKILLALKDKVEVGAGGGGMGSSGASDAIEALTALGYTQQDARAIIQKLDKTLPTEELVKLALKNLS